MRLSGTKTGSINQYRGLGNQLWDLAGNRPSLDLQFAESKSLVDATTGTTLVDHTRASSGTYVGSDGLIKTATTNLLLRSEEFDNASWTTSAGVSISPNAIESPIGTVTADLIEFGDANRGVVQGITGISGVSYTGSIWVKGTAGETISLAGANISSTGSSNKTLTGDWDRLSFTGTSSSTTLSFVLSTFGSATARNIYVWGAQLEQSSTVGEYVKTTSTINSAPRFDHDPTTGESLGLLVEEQRTNYLINSESFAGWTVAANGLTQSTASAIAAPNGQSGTVQLFTEDLTTGVHRIFVAPLTGQSTQTHSVFVKAAAGTREIYFSSDGPTGTRQNIVFNLQTGSLVNNTGDWSNVFITPYSSGWYRIGGTITDNGGSTLFIIGLNNVTSSYTGDGTSGLYLWGAQLEAGSFPTSYIPTEGSAVTRAADVASITGTNFSSWYNTTQGTVFTSQKTAAIDSQRGAYWFSAPPTVGRGIAATIDTRNVAQRLTVFNRDDVSISSLKVSPLVDGEQQKIAHSWSGGTQSASLNGLLSTASYNAIYPGINQLSIGFTEISAGSPQYLSGSIKRLAFWPQRLPDSTLQGITQE